MVSMELHCGDSTEILRQYPDNQFDSVVTDPPYLIGFMNKGWDKATNDLTPVFRECLRVLKPGGHLLSFAAARTYHRLAVQIEDAGFEIRDMLAWIYASGFPKGQDIGLNIDKIQTGERGREPTSLEGQEWFGWKTSLKPAIEPIVMARKPLRQSISANVLEYGTGALNIQASRIPWVTREEAQQSVIDREVGMAAGYGLEFAEQEPQRDKKPAIKSFRSDMPKKESKRSGKTNNADTSPWEDIVDYEYNEGGRYPSNVLGEIPENQKPYLYCGKVTAKERNIGCDTFEEKPLDPRHGDPVALGKWAESRDQVHRNNHPTVKPVKLMKYLIELVTPRAGTVLDPFMGSGSTGMAAKEFGCSFVGIDLDEHYVNISKARIEAWANPENTFDQLFS